MTRLRVMFVIALLAGCWTASDPAARWSGCYSLTRGIWDQMPESLLVALPGAVLRLAADTSGYRRKFQGAALPDSAHIHHTAWLGSLDALWWVAGDTDIRITTGGLAGVTLDLHGTPVALRGTVTTFTGVLKADSTGQLRPWRSRAPVQAHREACSM
jgi:hypothetical protein